MINGYLLFILNLLMQILYNHSIVRSSHYGAPEHWLRIAGYAVDVDELDAEE